MSETNTVPFPKFADLDEAATLLGSIREGDLFIFPLADFRDDPLRGSHRVIRLYVKLRHEGDKSVIKSLATDTIFSLPSEKPAIRVIL